MYVHSDGSRKADPNRKYNRNHWAGCICSACEGSFKDHNRETFCVCNDCDRTRDALIQAKENQAEILPPERVKVPSMATVNLCDKCGTMGQSKAMGTVVIVPVNDKADVFGDAVRTTGPADTTKRLEICPGCVGELMDWLNSEPLGERPRAYKEAWTPAPKVPDLTSLEGLLNLDSETLTRLAIEAGRKELNQDAPKRD